MIKELTKLATHLDANGHKKEANYLDANLYKASKKDKKSKVPNPIRTNYDYGEEGYNFLDKIRNRLKKKKNKKKK